MKTITIDPPNLYPSATFSGELQKIKEPFEVKFNYNIKEIPSYLFCGTSLTKITIPNSVIKIKNSAFDSCRFLEEIILPNSLEYIDINAFGDCSYLSKIKLPNSIIRINDFAFGNCTSLTKITIPPSIQYLGNNIFSSCFSLKEIIIPMSKEKFLSTVGNAEAFFDRYENLISFNDKSLDELLIKNNLIESIITNLEER